MEGYLLLADGTRLDGTMCGADKVAVGWVVANTSVVGFQEMVTDPAYRNAVLAFTYPEIGNVGVTAAFAESGRVQVAGLVVRVLSTCRSHYRSEDNFEAALRADGTPCLCDVDTRGLAVHLREKGEMAAAIAPARVDEAELGRRLETEQRPVPGPADSPVAPDGSGPVIAVLDLGARRSDLAQIGRCAQPRVFEANATAADILASRPAGVLVSDGPGLSLPPAAAVETLRDLVGKVPVMGFGLGNIALGLALGCEATFLKRGHHGANCPVRRLSEGTVEVTSQRHSVVLGRASVETANGVKVTREHLNDGTVEGISADDGRAVGLQAVPQAPMKGMLNPHIEWFVGTLCAS
jgi:carbamoyl-phosphate synthase small subunit